MGKIVRTCLVGMAILFAGGMAWGQPEWEEISPLPGHDVGSITRIITEDSGVWTTVSDHPGANPYLYFRPYYSSNGGDSWELRDSGIPIGVSVIAVQANPHNPERALASVRYGPSAPYLSLDRGLTWQQASAGISILTGSGCEAGWFADGLHAWCYVYFDLDASYYFFSSDSGATWSGYYNLGGNIKLMTLDDIEGHIIQSHVAGLRMSTDFGATWRCWWDTTFTSYYFGGTGPRGSAPGTIYASADYYWRDQMRFATYPVISQDTCRTWQFLNPADTMHWQDTRFCDILVDPEQPGHLFYTIVDTVFESTDNGQSWIPLWGGPIGVFFKNIIGYDPSRDWIYATGAYPLSEGPSERGIGRLRRGNAIDPRRPAEAYQQVLRIFPAPISVGHNLTIEIPTIVGGEPKIVLFDLLGRQVWAFPAQPAQGARETKIQVVIPNLPQGSYFLQIGSPVGTWKTRIVVVK
ncbi:T9SS type A sorting domain-containing protein [bacterium]|nr:T9SS type A sorting domain-containing protein [bacterium]